MKLSEAIRVAEKAKSWLDRLPEQVAAIEALQNHARSAPEREPSTFDRIIRDVRDSFGEAWSEFAEGVIGRDLPDPESDNAAERRRAREEVLTILQRTAFVEGWEQCRLHYGHQESDFPGGREFHGVECEIGRGYMCTCDGAAANEAATGAARSQYPDPAPAVVPPKVGDTVPDRDAAKRLPHGTLIKDGNGMHGLVSESGSGERTVVRWTEATPVVAWPATVVTVP